MDADQLAADALDLPYPGRAAWFTDKAGRDMAGLKVVVIHRTRGSRWLVQVRPDQPHAGKRFTVGEVGLTVINPHEKL